MNPAAILALIGDLYQQLADLKVENAALQAALAKKQEEQPND
jgi:hypothetical protein